MKVLIFGAGVLGKRYCNEFLKISEENEVVCFIDNDKNKHGTILEGIPVMGPETIKDLCFDKVVIANAFANEVRCQLEEILGDDKSKIEVLPVPHVQARVNWLKDYANLIYNRNIQGNIAEAGVFRGDFAAVLNQHFPDRILYLFDTFEGFPVTDVEIDNQRERSVAERGHYSATSEELVMSKMSHPEKCVIRKGYFPETGKGIKDRFCFVNLDLDLYQPTLEGLKFFWDKMVPESIILIHDFFAQDYPNVKTAVYDFEKYIGKPLMMIPIGDSLSIAIAANIK